MNKYHNKLICENPYTNEMPVVFSVTNLKEWRKWWDSPDDFDNATGWFTSGFISYDIRRKAA